MNDKLTGNRLQATGQRSERGQTLVVALIILGILLILGFVFLSVINRNIVNSARLYGRSVANDIAEAGVRYAHSQLLNSQLGADWRGIPTPLVGVTATQPNFTTDPDALYLRPATGLAWPGDPTRQRDLGGPDGLGSYVRVPYTNGRALVRVRYGPTDANILANSPIAPLRNSSMRNYLILESVGRVGSVSPTDPTRTVQTGPVQYSGYNSTAQLQQALAKMRLNDQQLAGSRRLRAFASIGITESARFITNKDRVTRPVEIGIPTDLGSRLGNILIANNPNPEQNLALHIGTSLGLFGVPGSGGMQINADVQFEGHVIANLNRLTGDMIAIAGSSNKKDDNSWLTLNITDNTGQTSVNKIGDQLDSRFAGFDTVKGAFIDGVATSDPSDYARAASRKDPPSILTVDPDTGQNRYRNMTRESGQAIQTTINGVAQVVNTGQFGHGQGVYVNNFSDSQVNADETSRANSAVDESLVNDWLNPGNAMARSGWKGPYYIPPAAYVQLNYDGFTITRNSSGTDDEKYWRLPNGNLPASQSNVLRYRLSTEMVSQTVNGVPTLVPQTRIFSNLNTTGKAFNGVLFFEGNVRVRGVIPTDVQMSIVSMGTIYIEGSVTKGIVGNRVTAGYPDGFTYPAVAEGARLTRASRSMLLLAARDYVAVNTTMFVGPSNDTQLEVIKGTNIPDAIRLRAGLSPASTNLVTELPLNPNSTPNPENPNNWLPFAYGYGYTDTDSTFQPIPTRLVITHSMDTGTTDAAFIQMNLNPNYANSGYYFPRTATDWTDTTQTILPPLSLMATNLLGTMAVGTDPYHLLYGLGGEESQRYSRFETVAFPLVNNTTGPGIFDSATGWITSDVTPDWLGDSPLTLFTQASVQATNEISIRPGNAPDGTASSDYMLQRAAIVPADVRIEATIFAENGSFFVIPGTWFNQRTEDTRAAYEANVVNLGDRSQADDVRLRNFGSTPITPFYGEPIDVRIRVMGAVSENLPPTMSQQAEWLRKWAWIPRQSGSLYHYGKNRPVPIPDSHVAGSGWEAITDPNDARSLFVPNLTIEYDSVLGSGRANGFPSGMTFGNDPFDPASPVIRWDEMNRPLPPLPRLPVSPTLAYFGEVK